MNPGVLTDLLHPVPPETLRAHWGLTPMFVKGSPGKFQTLMDVARFEALIHGIPSPELTATFPDPGNQMFERGRARPVLRADRSQIDALRSVGASVTLENLHHHDEPLMRLARSLKQEIGHAGEVKVLGWYSPPGVGVPVHFDGAGIISLQVSGTKRWRVSSQPALAWPDGYALGTSSGGVSYTNDPGRNGRADWEYDIEPRDESDFLELTMAPGDLLYMPAGTWHTTEASDDQASLGISISFAPLGFWDLLAQVARPLLRPRESWRSTPPVFRRGQDGAPSEELDRFFVERLQELQQLIAQNLDNRSSLHAMWCKQVASTDMPRPAPSGTRPAAGPEGTTVQEDSVLMFRDGRLPVVSMGKNDEGGDRLHIFDGENEVAFDEPDLIPFGQKLASQVRFAAREASAWGGGAVSDPAPVVWERVQPLLQALVQEGVLCVLEPEPK
jgi:ribosomal protein L16 Arg81 hydroxylase